MTRTTPTGRTLWSVPTLAEAIGAAGGRCQGARPAGRCETTDTAALALILDPEAGPVVLCPACLAGRRALLTRIAAATGTGQTRRPAVLPAPPSLGGTR